MNAKRFDASQYVHEYITDKGTRWHIVAEWRDGRYYAPMPPRIAKLTGCHTIFGSLGYVLGNSYHYKRRSDALRRAREVYGEEPTS